MGVDAKGRVIHKYAEPKLMHFAHSLQGYNPLYDKPNQDSYMISTIKIGIEECPFYGVADGHGKQT